MTDLTHFYFERTKNKNTLRFFWMTFLILLSTLFFFFANFYKWLNYKTFEGIVVKEEKYVVKLYVLEKEVPLVTHKNMYLNGTQEHYTVLKIESAYQLGLPGYMEVTYKINLKEEDLKEEQRLKILFLESEETLFEKWNHFWKRKVRT